MTRAVRLTTAATGSAEPAGRTPVAAAGAGACRSGASGARSSARPATIALAGCGRVGGALLGLIAERNARAPVAERFEIDRVLVRNRNGRRSPIPGDLRVVTDPDAFLDSPATTAVEAIGGIEPALGIARRTLERGANFITANKALIARHGPELQQIAITTGARLRFEGAVGGGIPIVRTLRSAFSGTRIRRITGILNGTCNFILSAMEDGRTFAGALEDARRRGFAEADASRDLDGRDADDKIRILAWIAWGIDPSAMRTDIEGLGEDPDALVSHARERGTRVRLIAECRLEQGAVRAFVRPVLAPPMSGFARTIGADNRIRIETTGTGVYVLSGPGAGGIETAAAVFADLPGVDGA